MDNIIRCPNSQETLRRVAQNDPSLTELTLSGNSFYAVIGDEFYSDNSDDYSALGAAIANNIHLEKLIVKSSNNLPLTVADRGFYDDLKSNPSISNLRLWCYNRNVAGGIVQEILKVYRENNSQLTVLGIYDTDLQNGGDRVIVDTLSSCSNLQRVTLRNCSITDTHLLPIVDAIRGHRMLEELSLNQNNIGNAGCEALATLNCL